MKKDAQAGNLHVCCWDAGGHYEKDLELEARRTERRGWKTKHREGCREAEEFRRDHIIHREPLRFSEGSSDMVTPV